MFKALKKLIKKKPAAKSAPKPAPRPAKKHARKGALKPKRVAARKAVAVKPVKPAKTAKPIGRVTHYYTSIKVAIVKFSAPPKLGSTVRFHGATTDFSQPLISAQYDHQPVKKIPKGKQVGVKVKSRVREGDSVHLQK